MKFRMYFIGLVLGLVLFGCGETRDVKQIQTEKPTKPKEVVSSVKVDTIYPKEFQDGYGLESYKKLHKGIYVYEKSDSDIHYSSVLRRLDFFDENGELIKEFDIRKNNPYTKKNMNINNSNYTAYVYDSFSKIPSKGEKKHKGEVYYNSITQRTAHTEDHIPVISYQLIKMDDTGVVGWECTNFCFDEKGNILRKFENLNIDPREFCISENKKFFCISYGGLRGENLTKLRNSGIRIYEIESGKLVYQLDLDDKHRISGPAPDNESLKNFYGVFGVKGNEYSSDRSKIYNMIDFELRMIYSKKISREERRKIKGSDKEGFIMKDGSRLNYEKDFSIERF